MSRPSRWSHRRRERELNWTWWVTGCMVLGGCLGIVSTLRSGTRIDPPLEFLWPDSKQQATFWAAERSGVRPCPLVYVYQLRTELTDFRPNGNVERDLAPTNVPGVFVATNAINENANLLEVILTRLNSSTRCSTNDPTSADLFLVPVLPKVKHWSEWVERCEAMLNPRHMPLVHSLYALEHLEPRTARRHVFIFPRVGYMPKCVGWWAMPMPPLIRQFARVAVGGYEQLNGDFQRANTLERLSDRDRANPQNLVPRLVSAPYVANVRWSTRFQASPPWKPSRTPRAYLFAYSGSPHGSSNAVELRVMLSAICRNHPMHCATAVDGNDAADPADVNMRIRSTLAKRNATFCLEPPGLTPGRASIVSSLLLGCIPVLFAPEQDLLWPLHWGDWIRDSRLMIPAPSVARDPAALLSFLAAVPTHDVERMQSTIAARAHALQYAFDDVPGDALEVLLRGLRDAVTARHARFRRDRFAA